MPQLSNSPRQQTQLMLEARKSFSLGLWFKTRDQNDQRRVVDLTGATLTFVMAEQAYQGGDIVITQEATVAVPDAGYARLDLQASDLDLSAATYLYSFTLVTAEGYSAVVVEGEIEVSPNTNPAVDNVYDGGTAADSLTVELMENSQINVIVNALAAGELTIGTVITVDDSEDADAVIGGAYPNQVLNLWLPKGADGSPGDEGVRGSNWYVGHGAPGSIPDSLPGDQYLDLDTGDIYELS